MQDLTHHIKMPIGGNMLTTCKAAAVAPSYRMANITSRLTSLMLNLADMHPAYPLTD